MLVAFSEAGAYQWHAFYGSVTNEAISTMLRYPDGTILAGGRAAASWGTPVAGHPLPGSSAMNFFRFDADGNIQWNTFTGDSVTGSQLSNAFLAPTSDSELWFVGSVNGSFGQPPAGREYTAQFDVAVGSLESSTGRLLRVGFWGGSGQDVSSPSAAVNTCDQGLIVGGASDAEFGTPIEAQSAPGIGRGLMLKLAPRDVP